MNKDDALKLDYEAKSDHQLMENAQGDLERIKLVQTGVGIGKPEQEPTDTLLNALDYAIVHGWPAESLMRLTAIRGADKLRHSQSFAQPEQEPVGKVQIMGSYKGVPSYGCLIPHSQEHQVRVGDSLYTTPPKREWVGLTEEQFVEAARLAEAGNYLVAFQRIQQWLKEKNT